MSHTAFLSPSLEVMLERLASLDEGDCIGKTSGNFQKARMAKTVLKDYFLAIGLWIGMK